MSTKVKHCGNSQCFFVISNLLKYLIFYNKIYIFVRLLDYVVMKIYGISFTTSSYGGGVALVIADNPNIAFQVLKTEGKLNSSQSEYKLLEARELSHTHIKQPTLVYENYSSTVVTKPAEEIHKFPFKTLSKVAPFLYQTEYDILDYEFAARAFSRKETYIPITGCSSIREGNFFGRNLDWYYNNNTTFVIKVPRKENRFASIGVATSIPKLTDAFVSSGRYSDYYKLLPFYTMDGINEYSVFCNTNVVPLEKYRTIKTIPEIEAKRTLCSRMLPRFILDNFTSASAAVEYIKNYVAVFLPSSIQDQGFEAHIMVGDKNNTYIIEFIENKVVITEHNKMTNFLIHGVNFNQDGTVYTQETSTPEDNPVVTNNITPHGVGLERYNLMATCQNANTKAGMRHLLDSLMYTKAYKDSTNPFWYSEFVDKAIGTNLLTPIDDNLLSKYIQKAKEEYSNRNRNNPITWYTSHSSIYDIEEQRLYIKPQENNVEYVFNLK